MGNIEIDHTGSGGGITLSSDGTDLLLDGSAVGGGGGGATSVSGSGTGNIIGGTNAGADLASASAHNLFLLEEAGTTTTTGQHNIALGQLALHGSDSTAQTGSSNVAIGSQTLENITTGRL